MRIADGARAALAVATVAASVVAAGSTSRLVRPETTSTPPSADPRPFAFADATGAVVLVPAGEGALRARALARSGEVAWEGELPPGVFATGCGPCPELLVESRSGRVGRFDGRAVRDVPLPPVPPAPAAAAIGAPEGELVWAASPRPGRLELHGLVSGRLLARLDLPPHAAGEAVVAVSESGAAAVVAPMADVLDVARRRLVLRRPSGVTRSAVLEVGVAAPDGRPTRAAVCVAPGGSAATAVVLGATQTTAWTLAAGGRAPAPVRVGRGDVPDAACVYDGRGPLVVIETAAGGGTLSVLDGETGAVLGRGAIGGVHAGAVCPRAGRIVATGEAGVVAADRRGVHRVRGRGLVDAGCTPSGEIWTLDRDGSVRWRR